jgi:hypothetical protein
MSFNEFGERAQVQIRGVGHRRAASLEAKQTCAFLISHNREIETAKPTKTRAAAAEATKPFAGIESPSSPQLKNAYGILVAACDSANSFAELFSLVRKVTGAKGMPTDDEQDLVRAMVVFAGAGLDSVVKQVLREALPHVVVTDRAARAKFEEFVQKSIGHRVTDEGTALDFKFLARVLTADSPRAALVDALISEMTSDSLQSVPQFARACAYLGIDVGALSLDIKRLGLVFKMRNEIVHELDVQLGAGPHKRRIRSRDDMIASAALLIDAAKKLLVEVDKRLAEARPREER